ncbi:NAD(P)/FAD-dependent oxidoreductase [Planosporangium flavigriseum]|uniref:Flavin-binding monooxygenase n=1 Tax=Planosporangium flavigriseum TaxID=373681 RepID=A0A8J3LEP2_9ACTN|nr:NAD(P)/FAD-dependent oxidoreductase [Planosporangium flavigriseum]NJC65096.1 NAD(P)/FAD-dependent oxidoreductase [Planosporangium flavigriseum]GIG71712.1 flavin-binding monooxygenase [Planosporangium flavigriseum]
MTTTEHVDVLIVGAGLSGIGAAHHLQSAFPRRSYAILEARDAIGGTWDLFRYPGVRSDSDMHTLGYRFRPWTQAKAIADGPSILRYIRDTAAEAGIDRHIRFGHRVTHASWSTDDARWTVEAVHDGEPVRLTAHFLYVCSGYYRYDAGHTPDFPGIEQFGGTVVHPQQWPADLDYTGKKVVVIGSGATAVTLVPAMTDRAAHVTMLQRSPTYITALPAEDPIANGLRSVLGVRRAYPVTRWKNVALSTLFYQLSQRRPKLVKSMLRKAAIKQLPAGYEVDTHFAPYYNPWDQRLCVVPDGDLFKAIKHGKASVVTDRIKEFTETGLRLESGAELEADIVVTATGLRLLAFGGMQLSVDGRDVSLPETMAYKGMMLSGVPNFAFTIGYTNASWTLKADLVSEYVVRLLRHLDAHGYDQCVPTNDDLGVTEQPLLDFAAGYVLRSIDEFPRAGSRAPWRLGMSYAHDVVALRYGRIDDGVLRFKRRSNRAPSAVGAGGGGGRESNPPDPDPGPHRF